MPEPRPDAERVNHLLRPRPSKERLAQSIVLLQDRIDELTSLLSEALERERVLREASEKVQRRFDTWDASSYRRLPFEDLVIAIAELRRALSTTAPPECAFHECTNPTPCPEHEAPAPPNPEAK